VAIKCEELKCLHNSCLSGCFFQAKSTKDLKDIRILLFSYGQSLIKVMKGSYTPLCRAKSIFYDWFELSVLWVRALQEHKPQKWLGRPTSLSSARVHQSSWVFCQGEFEFGSVVKAAVSDILCGTKNFVCFLWIQV